MSMLQKIEQLEVRVSSLEKAAIPSVANKTTETAKPQPEDEDDGVDLFASGSDEESEEAAKVREERLAAYNAKKSKSKDDFQIRIYCKLIFLLQNLLLLLSQT